MLKLLNLILQVCNSPCPRLFLSVVVFLLKPSLKFTYLEGGLLELFLVSLYHPWPHKSPSGILNQPMSKKAAMKETLIKAHNLISQNVLHIGFTHLLFLSFPGFLLLQFYLLWKKFLHYLVRNKGVQIPKGKYKEEEHQCITNL